MSGQHFKKLMFKLGALPIAPVNLGLLPSLAEFFSGLYEV